MLTVVVELAAPVALLGGRIRDVWVIAAWMLHAGIAALMLVVFPYPLFLVAFALLPPGTAGRLGVRLPDTTTGVAVGVSAHDPAQEARP